MCSVKTSDLLYKNENLATKFSKKVTEIKNKSPQAKSISMIRVKRYLNYVAICM